MWTRVELKERAKAALSQRYWKLVLVGVIASLVSGSFIEFEISESGSSDMFSVLEMISPLLMGIVFVALIIGILVAIFVINPIEIGTSRFFLKSLNEDTEIKEVLFAFDHEYMNIVKILFIRNLKIFLWSLLFLIPGIVKSYEYRMIPYLLAENPNLSQEEVFQISRQMMDGQKMEAFVLDWSFFGWELLSAFTWGLVGVFYVQPYVFLTDAALYDTLSTANGHPGRATQQEWRNTYTEYEEI